MRIEIDQSGKVEDTSRKTVVALTNSKKFTVLINTREKRKLQEKFRLIGQPKIFVYYVFATLLYLVIKYSGNLKNKIYIDIEYTGQTKIIEKILFDLVGEKLLIEWIKVGKQSKSHDLGYKVFVGKLKADKVIEAKFIENLINKKTGGYLNSRLKLENRYSALVIKRSVTNLKKKSRI